MKDNSLKTHSEMWKKLAVFTKLTPEHEWQKVAKELKIPLPEARRMMVAIQDAQQELMAQTGQHDDVYQAWSWSQWCEMTHLLEIYAAQEKNEDLKEMTIHLLKQQRLHPAYSVYTQLRSKFQDIQSTEEPLLREINHDDFMEHKVSIIEECLLSKNTILIETTNQKILNLIACKLSFLEGEMTLIAEETHDHGLLALALSEIVNIKSSEKIKEARAGQHEVNEFISALRAMSENELRLVLKIKDPQNFNLKPDYQFLGKPYFVTNPEGDLIWAAWVETSDELYDWLYEMEHFVEILEPSEFILDFAAYCEEKEKKLA
jgi:hypothetical protein